VTTILLVLAISQAEEIPATVRASPAFCGAISDGALILKTKLEKPSIALGESVEYSVTMAGMRNPNAVSFPKLEWPGFRIEVLPKEVAAGVVAFRFRLWPREAKAWELPAVRLDYFVPRAAEGKRLRTQYTDAITLTVLAPATPVWSVPERFLAEVPPMAIWQPSWHWWLIPGMLLMTVAAIAIWHWRNPGGARLAKRLQQRQVRAALAALDRAKNADVVHAAVTKYLQDRHCIEAGMTREEMSARLGANAEVWSNLLAKLDAARFGGIAESKIDAREAILTDVMQSTLESVGSG
jgi:hypothetical protein